ncbi:MAG: hypothetical protein AAB331_03365 [Planctomycetota bacterium]
MEDSETVRDRINNSEKKGLTKNGKTLPAEKATICIPPLQQRTHRYNVSVPICTFTTSAFK